MTDILLMPHVIEDMSCSVRIQLRLSAPHDDRSPSPVQATLPRLRDMSGSNDSSDDPDEVEVEDAEFEDEEEEEDCDNINAPTPSTHGSSATRCRTGRLGGREAKPPAKASTSSEGTDGESIMKKNKDNKKDVSPPPPKKKISNAETNLAKLNNLQKLNRICTIGTGTFGRVFLCRESETKKYRALKAMPIGEVVKTKQVDHVFSEKRILETLDHPFIIKLHWACHDDHHLYMLFDYIPGGELFSYLRAMGYFTAPVGRFYAVEIILALEYLHKKSTVYRDLKPENLLLNRDGHLKITDFGFAKKLEDRDDSRTWTLCGTPEYLAPELIENRGHNKAVDWWALGVLVFEMLAGYPPFYGNNPMEIYERVLAGKMKFPKYFDLVAKDLVRKMLNLDRTKRLGNMKGGAEDVKKHKWFRPINWTDALNNQLKPPIIPKVTHDGDPGNFDEYEEEDWEGISSALAEEIEVFEDW